MIENWTSELMDWDDIDATHLRYWEAIRKATFERNLQCYPFDLKYITEQDVNGMFRNWFSYAPKIITPSYDNGMSYVDADTFPLSACRAYGGTASYIYNLERLYTKLGITGYPEMSRASWKHNSNANAPFLRAKYDLLNLYKWCLSNMRGITYNKYALANASTFATACTNARATFNATPFTIGGSRMTGSYCSAGSGIYYVYFIQSITMPYFFNPFALLGVQPSIEYEFKYSLPTASYGIKIYENLDGYVKDVWNLRTIAETDQYYAVDAEIGTDTITIPDPPLNPGGTSFRGCELTTGVQGCMKLDGDNGFKFLI